MGGRRDAERNDEGAPEHARCDLRSTFCACVDRIPELHLRRRLRLRLTPNSPPRLAVPLANTPDAVLVHHGCQPAMQRPNYSNPPPAHSPPLHHPVPQHVSTVPQLRSPPPPQPPSQPHSGYGYGGQQQQQQQGGQGGQGFMGGAGGQGGHPAFGNFMNDQTAQMGFQIGKSAVNAGQEYMEQNV